MKRSLFQIIQSKNLDEINGAYANHMTIPRALLAYRLFCPVTQIVAGKVVLFNNVIDEGSSEQINDFKEWVSKGNSPDSYNCIVLNGFFASSEINEYELLDELGNSMKDSWKVWLFNCYPDRQFETFIDYEDWSLYFRQLN